MDHVKNETVDGLIASQLNGRVTRRQLAMGVLAIPAFTAFIAACGSDDDATDATTGGTTGDGTTPPASDTTVAGAPETTAASTETTAACRIGRQHPRRSPGSGEDARPDRHGRPRRIRPRRPVLRVPLRSRRRRRHRPEPGHRVERQRRLDRVDVHAPRRRQVAERRRLHRRRRRRNHGAHRRSRRLGSVASIAAGNVTAPDPTTVLFTLGAPNASLPYLVSIFNPQSAITPVDYAAGTHARRAARRHRPVEAGTLRPHHGRHVRAQRRLVGRHDAARHGRLAVLHRRQLDGHRHAGRLGRRDRAVLGRRWRRADQRRQLRDHRDAHNHAPRDLDATATRVSSPTSESARRSRCASIARRWSTRCSRARPTSPTTTSIAPLFPFYSDAVAAARARHRHGQAAPDRRRVPRRHHRNAQRGRPAGDPAARRVDPDPGCRRRLHARR